MKTHFGTLTSGFGVGVSLTWVLVDALSAPSYFAVFVFFCVGTIAGAFAQGLSFSFLVLGSSMGRRSPWLKALLPALALSVFLKSSYWSLFDGDWVSQQSWQPGARLGVLIGFFLLVLKIGQYLVIKSHSEKGAKLVLGLVFAAFSAFCFYSESHKILMRKYPAAHDILMVWGILSAGVSGALWLGKPWSLVGKNHILLSVFMIILVSMGMVDFTTLRLRSTLLGKGVLTPRVMSFALSGAGGEIDVAIDPVLLSRLESTYKISPERLDVLVPWRRNQDVVLITIDTLRHDALSISGGSAMTPYLDQFAKDGFVFSQAWSQFPATRYAVNSFLAGQYPTAVDLDEGDHEGKVPRRLPESLRAAGYTTRAFTSFPKSLFALEESHLTKGFIEFNNDVGESISRSKRVVERSIEFLKTSKENDKPRFLWVHLFDPHGPYHQRGDGIAQASLRERYDREVSHVDSCLADLFSWFATMEQPPLVIVHSDHGEEFQDHGGIGHNSSLYQEQIRVPLIFWGPGIMPGSCDSPVELIDLPKTVRRYLGLKDEGLDRGNSLLPILLGDNPSHWPAPCVLSQFRWPQFAQGNLDAVRERNWKLIHNRGLGLFELFDLDVDPEEQHNLALNQPKRLARLQTVLATMRAYAGLSDRHDAPQVVLGRLLKRAAQEDLSASDFVELRTILRQEPCRDPALLVPLLRNQNKPLRHAVLLHVMSYGEEDGVAALRTIASDESASASEEARIALAVLGEDIPLATLPWMSPAFTGSRRLIPWLARYLAGDQSLRFVIHQSLGQEGRDLDLESMALRVLIHRGDASFMPSLYGRISGGIGQTEQGSVLAEVLKTIPVDLGQPILRRLIQSPDRGLRDRAMEAASSQVLPKGWIKAASEAEVMAISGRSLAAQPGALNQAMVLFKKCGNIMKTIGVVDYGIALEMSFFMNTWDRRSDAIPLIEPFLAQKANESEAVGDILDRLLTIGKSHGKPFLGKIELLPGQKPRAGEHGRTPLLVRVSLDKNSSAMVGGLGPETEYLVAILLGPKGERLSEPQVLPLPNLGVLPGESMILAAPLVLARAAGSSLEIGIRLGRADLDLVPPIRVKVSR